MIISFTYIKKIKKKKKTVTEENEQQLEVSLVYLPYMYMRRHICS